MAEPVQTRTMCFKLSLIAILFLVAVTHAVDPSAPDASGDGPADATPPPASSLQPTRESIYRHLAAELQHALGAEEHIKGVFAGLAGGVSDSITTSVMPSLQAMIDNVVERAEDAWVTADDAGRTVQVKECVDGAEYDAQQVAKRAVEKMRGCVESLEQEGARRAREASRLLSDIDRISKSLVAALETCVSEQAELQATADAEPSGTPVDTTSTPSDQSDAKAVPEAPVAPAAPTAPAAPAVPATAAEDASSCTKDNTEGSTPCSCPKCKKSKAKETVSSQEEETTQGDQLEPKKKCKGGHKCEKGKEAKDFKKGEKVPEGEKPKKADRGKDQRNVKKSATTEEVSEEAGVDDGTEEMQEGGSAERTEKQGKGGKKAKYTAKEEKQKGKYKKGKKEESLQAEEQPSDQQSEKYKTNENKKKNKKTDGKTKDAEIKEGETLEKETNEKSNDKKNVEGKYKKEKGEGKGKGKKKTQEEPSEGKGRRKRDLLAVQENPEETGTVNTVSKESEQPTEAESSNAAPQWPTEGSNAEEKNVIACLQTPVLKPLMEEKTRVYQKLQGMLKRVQEKEQDAPTCILDHMRKAEAKINAIKTRMASCAERKMREEL